MIGVVADSEHAMVAPARRRRPLDVRIMELVGTDWCGNDAPPLTNRNVYVHDDGVTRVFSTIDDGGFVGIGYPDEWQVIMRTRAARLFAWWTFKVWVASWFGLREHIYYRALNHRVGNGWRFSYKRHRPSDSVWVSSHDEWRSHRPNG